MGKTTIFWAAVISNIVWLCLLLDCRMEMNGWREQAVSYAQTVLDKEHELAVLRQKLSMEAYHEAVSQSALPTLRRTR